MQACRKHVARRASLKAMQLQLILCKYMWLLASGTIPSQVVAGRRELARACTRHIPNTTNTLTGQQLTMNARSWNTWHCWFYVCNKWLIHYKIMVISIGILSVGCCQATLFIQCLMYWITCLFMCFLEFMCSFQWVLLYAFIDVNVWLSKSLFLLSNVWVASVNFVFWFCKGVVVVVVVFQS